MTGAGLERFYDLRDPVTAPIGDAGVERQHSFAWLAPLKAAAQQRSCDDTVRLTIDVQGIQCAACVWLLEKVFRRHPGALRIEVNPGVGRLDLTFDPSRLDIEAYLAEIGGLGYRTGPPLKGSDQAIDGLLVRLGLCAAIAMNSMIFSLSFYFGMTEAKDGDLASIFAWLNLALATAAVAIGGSVFIKGAFAAARQRLLHLDVPIAVGIVLGYAGSVWSFLASDGSAAYFDTLTLFIALMLGGRLLQRRILSRNRQMLLRDQGVDGLMVRSVGADGLLRVIRADAIVAGDRLVLAPGEILPVESRLLDATAPLSLEWINGESDPADFVAGALVPAGARNVVDRAIRVEAAGSFEASSLQALLTAPDSDRDDIARSPLWHRVASFYVVAVLTAAVAAILVWLPAGAERAIEVGVAVLVVTCPCALGLATPLAYELALTWARRHGLFVRRVGFLERALRVRKVVFDKTGTLTLGQLIVAEPTVVAELDGASFEALHAMTGRSNHPKSRAILQAIEDSERPTPTFDPDADVREVPGRGMLLTSETKCWEILADPSATAAGGVMLLCDGATVARLPFREDLRPDAAAQVAALTARGIEVWLASGDRSDRAHAAAAELGIPPERVRGDLSPQGKADFVAALDDDDTMMVGDGINDAPAFAVAFTAATPAVDRATLPARADIFYLGTGLLPVARALSLAALVRRTIVRNLVLAAAYNTTVLALAFAGLMSPLLCAVLMPLSSIAIVLATAHSFRSSSPTRTLLERALPDPVRQRRPGGRGGDALRLPA